jgi:two-component system NtrC family sensor kinase
MTPATRPAPAHDASLLSEILVALPHPVYWKDASLRYVGANPAFLALRGVSSLAAIDGLVEPVRPVDTSLTPVLTGAEGEVLFTRRPAENRRVTTMGPDGAPRSLMVSVFPRLDRGRFDGIIGVITDVTQVGQRAWKLAQASRLEAIGQLAAGIAHEINTPIQFISDNTRFLQDCFSSLLPALEEIARLAADASAADPSTTDLAAAVSLPARIGEIVTELDLPYLAEEIPSALAQSLEGLNRVSRIVRATKDFSHPGSDHAPTDLNRAVESTVQVCRNEWKYVGELTVDLDPQVGLVPCYESELKQVVLNLIVNAAQALQAREPVDAADQAGRIRVSTRRTGDHVIIQVADNGAGMDQHVLQRCFDPFFTTKEVGKGTGQGLSLARDVVRKHLGTIRADSTPGTGTRFTLTLPAPLGGSTDSQQPAKDPVIRR